MRTQFKHILIINGPNLNLLGRREKSIYGNVSFEDYLKDLRSTFPEIQIDYFQSNHEGALIDKIHEVGFLPIGIVLNPGGYSHTSIAIRDAISGVDAPVIEVHITNVYERESFRWGSYVGDVCVKTIIGKGLPGYQMAIEYLTGRD